ncbi:MAG: hypothetical protein JSV58_00580 [Candidatus Bathyarchaeota archaeon]|nr:MAG: hypothetical protein JSV58_00580 [Candidatus Bathyarchaeota archaeon]
MKDERLANIEISLGVLLVTAGLILWWWSRLLLWILVYPPPMAKTLVEDLPIAFWGLGALLIVDGIRRRQHAHATKRS